MTSIQPASHHLRTEAGREEQASTEVEIEKTTNIIAARIELS
jgi:hypothetical protein